MKNIKKYGLLVFIFIISLVFITSGTVYAQGRAGELKENLRDTVNDIRGENKQLNTSDKENFKNEVGELRNEFKNNVENKNSEIIEIIKSLRNEYRNRIKARREEALEKMKAEREKFREELGKIKDEVKRDVVERIVNKIAKLNIKITDNSIRLVDNIDNVLLGIKSRIGKVEAGGLDISVVKADIALAEEALTNAREAIAEQVGKNYSIEITEEDVLREIMQTLRNSFGNDIKAVRAEVKLAHQAVRKCAVTLAQIPDVDNDQEPEENNSVE